MTEWNLAHHLANEIGKYIFWLNNDIEVTKRNYDRHRPDIIFHKRGVNALNFLIIELKMHGNTEEDIRKIKEDWMHPPLSYRFGASVVVRSKTNWTASIFEKNNREPIHLDNTTYADYLSIPPITPQNKSIAKKIEDLVDEILKAKEKNPEADTSELEQEIDRLVYKLYKLTPEEIDIGREEYN